MISLRNVYYRFPGTPHDVLSDVSWKIESGQYACICGGNGSGKTTLLKQLNGLLKPTAGTVKIESAADGSVVTQGRTGSETLRVGMVFQNPDTQIIGATVVEDVAFGPENLALPPAIIRQRVENSLKELGIMHLKNRETHTLSGGEKRLVAIAGVLALLPDVIALDEPTAYLDHQSAQVVRRAIRRLNTAGITVIHVTHDVEDAFYANNVAIMCGGRIILYGKPSEILRRGEALITAGLKVPPLVELLSRLRGTGINVSPTVFTVEEAYTELMNLLGRGIA